MTKNNDNSTAQEEIPDDKPEKAEKNGKKSPMDPIHLFLLNCLIILSVIWLMFGFVLGSMQAPNSDMSPNIKTNDLVLYYRSSREFHAQDVVVVAKNNTDYIGRIVAVPGDTLDITDAESLVINGNTVIESNVYTATPRYEGFAEYFRKPEIVYVKEAADGTLTQIEEPFYRGGTALETLNGRPLTQNAMLDVTAGSDLVISNGTGNGLYRVPPDLDGKSQNSLEYVKIGAGAAGAENSSQLDMVSGDLELRLGVNDHQIMYRLTADGEWQVFSGDPTVYIIYHEEEPMPAPTGVNDNTAPYLMITAVILIAGAILLLIRKRKEGMENETDPL